MNLLQKIKWLLQIIQSKMTQEKVKIDSVADRIRDALNIPTAKDIIEKKYVIIMCLLAKRKDGIKIAETDIDVFKVFQVKNGFVSRMYTGPYQNSYYYIDLNGLYKCEGFDEFTFEKQPDTDWVLKHCYMRVPISEEEKNEKRKEFEDVCFVYVGFHSFKNLQDALKEFIDLKFADTFGEKEFDVVHCVIPKGTRYYEGLFDKKECYCSEEIKLNYN